VNEQSSFAIAAAAAAFLTTTAVASFPYQHDDGSSDSGVGLQGGGEIAWMHLFEVDPNLSTITSISTSFGTPEFPGASGVNAGDSFAVHLWGVSGGNPAGGGNMTFLGSWTDTIDAGSIGSDVLQGVSITPTDVSGFSHFMIGASVNHAAGFAPAPQDTSQASLGRAFVAGDVGGNWDPLNPAGGIGFFEMDAIGFPGVWLLRANAVPAPGALALLGLAGLLGVRRRRD